MKRILLAVLVTVGILSVPTVIDAVQPEIGTGFMVEWPSLCGDRISGRTAMANCYKQDNSDAYRVCASTQHSAGWRYTACGPWRRWGNTSYWTAPSGHRIVDAWTSKAECCFTST